MIRFRKRIRLSRHIHLNLGKHGVSVSVGMRGAGVTLRPRSITTHAGVPGSGVYYVQTQHLQGYERHHALTWTDAVLLLCALTFISVIIFGGAK